MSDHDGEECGCCAEWSEEEVIEQRARMRAMVDFFDNASAEELADVLKSFYTPERLQTLLYGNG